jgi:hypothetical protein
MYNTNELLSRVSRRAGKRTISLASLQNLSIAEIRNTFRSALNFSEARYLFHEAAEQQKKNKILETRILTRANPQLPLAIRAGIRDNAASRSYDSMFGSRSSSFVKSGSVASMFSPAGYLTELYREAKGLHLNRSAYNLDVRRPELAALLLSQKNMDEEISTLTLSNDILLSHVEKQTGINDDTLLEHFSTDRFSAATPYHQPYESLRHSVLALDPGLDALTAAPDVLRQADDASLLSIITNISPTLHNILTEEITADNAAALYEKNFSQPIEYFDSADAIENYYNLSVEEQVAFLGNKNNILFTGDDPDYEGSVYVDGRLTRIIFDEDDSIKVYQLNKEKQTNSNLFNYIDLVPLGGLDFEVRFSFKSSLPEHPNLTIRTGNGRVLYNESDFIPKANKHYSRQIKLTQSEIASGSVTMDLRRERPSGFFWAAQGFIIQILPKHIYILKLNKAIRLCRAAGITPEQLESLLYNAGTGGQINEVVISLLFNALYFRKKYNSNLDDALVLAGGNISVFAGSADVSSFDRLFNTPALAGKWFSLDGSKISIAPDAADASFAHDSLLRGLAVTHGELYQLGLMAGLITTQNTTLTLTLANISALYRLSLAARLNDLSVNELYLLFTVSLFTDATGTAFMQHIYQLSRWMTEAGLSATEVWMLSSTDYPQTLTPEMFTLRSTVAAAVSAGEVTAAADDAARRHLIAPYIAATLGLSSPDLAASLVFWCENARHFSLSDFLKLLLQETLSVAEERSLAGNLHVLAQHSLTVQALSLSEAEVNVLAGIPGTRQLLPAAAQGNALARLISLHYFHQWLNTLGRESGSVLAALNESRLTTALMASAMGLNEKMLTQALRCVNADASDKTLVKDWQTIYQVLQWLNVATRLNTMPQVVKQLVDIRLSGTTAAQPSWSDWKSLSRSLEAALTQRQAATLAASSAGRLSEVLCSWFLANVDTDGVSLRSRDELYNYFLIDNQVSAEVKTTRLAEAISGIQLYINRALNRIEPNVVADVSTRQFFIDWEMNSRYSTWGGVSRLAYYPENYVDPLQRIGQTKMMDELLQYINQSKLSEDTVEDAFKTYLARFETVADLTVISAYHDNVNSGTGNTWFVGRCREAVGEYYWRSVDMSRFSGGKLVANTWSEWVKIDAPINAWRDTVRPVIFRDRLYVSWVEQEEIASNGTSNPVISYRYTLKLAFLRHDGNWSSPWSYDITTQVSGVLSKGGITRDSEVPDEGGAVQPRDLLGLAVSGYQGEGSLIILIYKLQGAYDFTKDTTTKFMQGMVVYADGSSKAAEAALFSSLVNTLDTTNSASPSGITRRACYRFAVDYDVSSSLTMPDSTGSYSLTTMSQAKIPGISVAYSSEGLFVNLNNPTFTIKYASNVTLREHQIGMMAYCGKLGDKFRIANNVIGSLGKAGPHIIYNLTTPLLVSALTANAGISSAKTLEIYTSDALGAPSKTPIYAVPRSPVAGYDKVSITSEQANSYAKGLYSYMVHRMPGYAAFYDGVTVDKYLDIDTSVKDADALVRVTGKGVDSTFTAESEVPVKPASSFSEMVYNLNNLKVDAKALVFTKNKASLNVAFEVKSADGRILGSSDATLLINKVDYTANTILQLHETDAGVQYMQYGVYRIRLNTLLAPQLVSRANVGINAILSMETQQLPEDKLGKGFYVNITLPPYNPSKHGNAREFNLLLKHVVDNNSHIIHSGQLADIPMPVQLFVPLDEKPLNKDYIAKVYLTTQKITEYSNSVNVHFIYVEANPEKPVYDENTVIIDPIHSRLSGFDSVTVLQGMATSPLDFNSASALYYWELFYYVPMMCFRRLMQESKFEAARAWMNYIWNPNGYIVNGEIAPWLWNCRPLEETTSWNANPLDSIDPDAVAQNDPTHYKVATFMNFIEMLVTRGDMCYRELTRDALAEAKMWYVFAQSVMGDEPQDYGSAAWGAPSLASAASDTTRAAYQQALAEIEPDTIFPDGEEGDESVTDDSAADGIVAMVDTASADEIGTQARTANSLVGLFLPEYNPALTEMWATLRLRLYNLRHNLSIDGQPLSLSLYAEPADPATLLSSMVQASAGGAALPAGSLSLYRFPVMLERARNLVGQLTQFGSSLLSMAEHDDADAYSTLLMRQGMELMIHSIRLQQCSVNETKADIASMKVTLEGAQARLDKYTKLYDEDVSAGERQAMILADTASALTLAGKAMGIVGGAADLLPNTFGLACGGSRWGALSTAMATGMGMQSASIQTAADKISRSEMYRRRREEWEIQRNNAQSDVNQIEAQLAGMAIRLEAANLQVDYLETQQGHTLAQLEFMQRKFTNQALYSWMRGKLSAIYYQFFDIAQSCCLMAQEALRRELNDNSLTLVRGSAWNGATAGFMAGETLLLNLAEMDKAWMERDERALEITRTVSLAQVYAELPGKDGFVFKDKVSELLGTTTNDSHGNEGNSLKVNTDKELEASVKLADLNIRDDYKSSLGATRRIKQVSVTLPALVGPYEDIRAVLSYGGSVVMPRGCRAIAVSHGINDSGQFQLDFNDARYLPFEGIPVDDTGSLTLSFPDARGSQKALLASLNDIILHIRYTIQS